MHPCHSTAATSIGRFGGRVSSGTRSEVRDTPARRSARRRGTSRARGCRDFASAQSPTSLRGRCLGASCLRVCPLHPLQRRQSQRRQAILQHALGEGVQTEQREHRRIVGGFEHVALVIEGAERAGEVIQVGAEPVGFQSVGGGRENARIPQQRQCQRFGGRLRDGYRRVLPCGGREAAFRDGLPLHAPRPHQRVEQVRSGVPFEREHAIEGEDVVLHAVVGEVGVLEGGDADGLRDPRALGFGEFGRALVDHRRGTLERLRDHIHQLDVLTRTCLEGTSVIAEHHAEARVVHLRGLVCGQVDVVPGPMGRAEDLLEVQRLACIDAIDDARAAELLDAAFDCCHIGGRVQVPAIALPDNARLFESFDAHDERAVGDFGDAAGGQVLDDLAEFEGVAGLARGVFRLDVRVQRRAGVEAGLHGDVADPLPDGEDAGLMGLEVHEGLLGVGHRFFRALDLGFQLCDGLRTHAVLAGHGQAPFFRRALQLRLLVELLHRVECERREVDLARVGQLLEFGRDHRDGEAPVADVVLADGLMPEPFEEPGDGIADDDSAEVADVHLLGEINAAEIDDGGLLHLGHGHAEPPPRRVHVGDEGGEGIGPELDVDEAGAGDGGIGEGLGDVGDVHLGGDRGGDFARVLAELLAEGHRAVGLEVRELGHFAGGDKGVAVGLGDLWECGGNGGGEPLIEDLDGIETC